MANIFNSVSASVPKKNKFNLSHNVQYSCEMGLLYPILVQEVIPNDTFKVSAASLVRLAPLKAPMYSDVDVYMHFFFVPNRLIWTKWEEFITGSRNGRKLPDNEVPQKPFYRFSSANLAAAIANPPSAVTPETTTTLQGKLHNRTLADYLGFETVQNDFDTSTIKGNAFTDIDAMPFRAYHRIVEDYYIDENIMSSSFIENGWYDNSGVMDMSNTQSSAYKECCFATSLRRRCWKKDYFTSALPFPQKGDDVLIPGTGSDISSLDGAPVVGDLQVLYNPVSTFTKKTNYVVTNGITSTRSGFLDIGSTSSDGTLVPGGQQLTFKVPDSAQSGVREGVNSLSLDLSSFNVDSVSEGTIRELRRAMAAQRFLERKALGGTRYQEQNLAFFGIRGSDARLQRSEFLGGVKQSVVVSQLLQTSQTSETSVLGTPAGNAVSAGGDYCFNKTFNEYGFIVGMLSIIPKATYMNGMPKMYQRKDVYDYYWPQFAHIGEQEIKKGEVFYDYRNGDLETELDSYSNVQTFGYTPRYAEYRFRNSRVCGDFKDSLSFWTLGRHWSPVGEGLPALNARFLECRPSNRIFAVDSDSGSYDHIWCDTHFSIFALRPIPKYGESI